MKDQCIPKLLRYGELAESKHQVGCPKLRFKDIRKATLKSHDIPVETREDLALDRPSWCSLISRGTQSAEQHHRALDENKRAARKARTTHPPSHPLTQSVRTFQLPDQTHQPPKNTINSPVKRSHGHH